MSTCIDQSVGMKYCAFSKEMYLEVLQMYCECKDEKLEQIRNSYEQENWKSYVTYVHSLKSTSLSIGGVSLSELALSLEMAGKEYLAGTEEKLDYIKEHTNELLDLYVATVEEGLRIVEEGE
nr:Hpt domain-containing protein [Lachnospiraceae bacterium]